MFILLERNVVNNNNEDQSNYHNKTDQTSAIKYSLAVNGIMIKLWYFDIHNYFYHAYCSNSIKFYNHWAML